MVVVELLLLLLVCLFLYLSLRLSRVLPCHRGRARTALRVATLVAREGTGRLAHKEPQAPHLEAHLKLFLLMSLLLLLLLPPLLLELHARLHIVAASSCSAVGRKQAAALTVHSREPTSVDTLNSW